MVPKTPKMVPKISKMVPTELQNAAFEKSLGSTSNIKFPLPDNFIFYCNWSPISGHRSLFTDLRDRVGGLREAYTIRRPLV